MIIIKHMLEDISLIAYFTETIRPSVSVNGPYKVIEAEGSSFNLSLCSCL